MQKFVHLFVSIIAAGEGMWRRHSCLSRGAGRSAGFPVHCIGGRHVGMFRYEVAPRCGATRRQECLRHISIISGRLRRLL